VGLIAFLRPDRPQTARRGFCGRIERIGDGVEVVGEQAPVSVEGRDDTSEWFY
jgi:hypothetical protein